VTLQSMKVNVRSTVKQAFQHFDTYPGFSLNSKGR
jgi:hypothetical protein